MCAHTGTRDPLFFSSPSSFLLSFRSSVSFPIYTRILVRFSFLDVARGVSNSVVTCLALAFQRWGSDGRGGAVSLRGVLFAYLSRCTLVSSSITVASLEHCMQQYIVHGSGPACVVMSWPPIFCLIGLFDTGDSFLLAFTGYMQRSTNDYNLFLVRLGVAVVGGQFGFGNLRWCI
ncbi:hypothetical protein F2Q69_00040757 [Brassica cretica]|uniref:Uncharacterized protein n=1 Tax=Brassica cretica TaxID=69181 RepID=A0A8S9NFP9_BRACR|nr:hypothetical protein F2Q69_00040757 [Brassica cretica]